MQSFVCDRSSTLRTTTPFVESSCRDFQYVTQASHAMLRSLLLDECVFHRGSFAKNAAAFFKIYRSSRSDAFSRRSRRFSCSRVSVRDPASSSFSSTIRCFQFCKSDALIQRSRATLVRLRSPAIVARTASTLNSALYDRRCFPKTYLVSRLFANIREVSGKPGQAHLAQNLATLYSKSCYKMGQRRSQDAKSFDCAVTCNRQSVAHTR